MKDDFKVQRVAPQPDRTVEYRPPQGRPVMDVVARRPEPTATAAPQVAPVAQTTPSAEIASRPAAPAAQDIPVSTPPVQDKTTSVHAIEKPKRTHLRGFAFRPMLGGLAAIMVLTITGYVSFDTWISNNVVRKTTPSTAAVQGEATQTAEGSDENVVSESAIKSYAVAVDMPRVLSIEKLNVKARVLPMGINAQSAIEAPINIYDSGWYTGSAKPGTPGITFVDAHASGATREGLFAYLDTLKSGDVITIERGDGTVLKYAVRATEKKNLADIEMAKVLSPQHGIKEGLTLMTCTGSWVADKETYDQRAIVYAERI